MADEPKPQKPHGPALLGDDAIERVKSQIIYGTGYQRPPKQHQFQKGQSGNPKGRPKTKDLSMGGKNSANALALREARRLISVKEGDDVHQITAIEAVHRRQYVTAMKEGSAYAQKHIIERHDHAEREERRQISEDNEVWRNYVAKERVIIAGAEASKRIALNPLPHPDDIIIDDETGVRFVGPHDEESAARTQSTINLRHALMLQAALDERFIPRDDGDPQEGPGTAYEFARLMNKGLPPRLRLSEAVMIYTVDLYARHSKRWLLKEVYATWRKLGIKARRGKVFPKLDWGVQKLNLGYDLAYAVSNGQLDTDATAQSQFEEKAREFLDMRGG